MAKCAERRRASRACAPARSECIQLATLNGHGRGWQSLRLGMADRGPLYEAQTSRLTERVSGLACRVTHRNDRRPPLHLRHAWVVAYTGCDFGHGRLDLDERTLQ